VKDLEDEFLKDGWVEEDVLEITTVSEVNKWTSTQTWGFEIIEGERRYTRHVSLEHSKGVTTCKIVYDYSP
jgi:hypothetical protein